MSTSATRAESALLPWNPMRPAVMTTIPNAQTAVTRTSARWAGPAVGRSCHCRRL